MDDDRQKMAFALLDYVESRQKLARLRGEDSEVGEFYKTVGQELKTDPFMYLAKQYTLVPQSQVDALVRELAELEETTERLKLKAVEYGVSI
jgi:hypothetical protein